MNLLRSVEKRAYKLRSMLNDPASLELTEERLASQTRRNPELSVEQDRLKEFAEFYGLSEEEAMQIESITNKQALEDAFNSVETDSGLTRNYQDARLLYTARMQLAYTRFPVAYKLVQFINSFYPPNKRKNVRVLDYGCGVGDYGLAFATQGYYLTLCDIEGGNLDFARWRFEQRKLPHDVIPATEQNLYPALKQQDIVLAGEVFEHVREPVTVLKNIHAALPKGGLLWYSGYPDYQREVGGDHLVEAAEQREEALAFVRKHFRKATQLQMPGVFYRKL